VNVFRRDEEKVYNMVYRDGKSGRLYAKKFRVGGVTREKEYPLFKTHSKSRIFFFAVHDNEKKNSNILVHLDPELKRVKEMVIEFDFAWIEIQGRGAKGTTLTAHKVDRVVNTPRDNGTEEGKEVEPKVEQSKTSSARKDAKKAEPAPAKIEQENESQRNEVGKGEDPKNQATFEF